MSSGNILKSFPLATPEAPPKPAAPTPFKVELDDRAILLPDGKILQHVLIGPEESGAIVFDAIFVFNSTGRSPRLMRLSLADAGAFAAELINAVYAAKTTFVFGEGLKIAITVVANGYKLEVKTPEDSFELFLSTGVIWRFIKGLLMAIDAASPSVAN
jgi:hypothetical protein